MDLRREAKKGMGFRSVLVVLLLLCIIVLGTVIFIFLRGETQTPPSPDTPINTVTNGSIEGLDTTPNPQPSEIFQYKLNKSIYIETATSPAEISLENSEGNMYSMWAEYQIKDSGEVILTTETLLPNQYIQYSQLTHDIANGTYDVVVSMMIEDIDTHELITVVTENIKLYIGEKPKGGN